MRRIALLAVAMASVASTGAARAGTTDPWPFEITAQCRPGAYWWCPGSAFDRESIDWNLENMRDGGIGTAHIVPIYGAKGYEKRYIRYLSPEWMKMLDHIVAKAGELGIQVDMTTGTGWCFGGPDLPSFARDMRVRWDSKKKRISHRGGRNVKRPAPGGEGSMLNAYSTRAMRHYLERFSKAFDSSRCRLPRAQYHDSFEYAGDWCEEFLEEFRARRGYDLEKHLPTFFGKTTGENRDLKTRLKYDYRATLAGLHHDAMKVWNDWAHARGMLTRNEAHGSPANLLDVYALSDIPETEMFGAPDYPIPGFRRDPKMVRKGDTDMRILMMASSAAHVAHEPGRQLVSSESFTWLREHWHGTLAQIKLAADGFFLAGVNHIFYHGTCYSAKDAPWPGWFFYASTKADWRNSIWRDIRFLNDYIARCQSVLQAGQPANDVLVYWPVHDFWSNPEGLAFKTTVHGSSWMSKQRIGAVADLLLSKGYAFDFASDRMLGTLKVEGGKLRAPGGTYRCVLVPACRYMPPETMLALAKLSERGATLVVEKEIPSEVPGFGNLERRRRELAAARRRLEGARPVVVPEALAGLERAGVARETLVDVGLRYIRRRTGDGLHWYLIVNQSAKAHDGWLDLAVPFATATLYDPVTGRSGGMAIKHDGAGGGVYLQVEPGQSVVVRASPKTRGRRTWPYVKRAGEPTTLSGEWRVEFIEGEPALPSAYTLRELSSWTNAPDERTKAFAGAARYTLSFELPAAGGDDWLLDLGDVRESARVRVNGRDAGALFALPFRMRVGELLRPGRNTLEVEVTNLAANRIKDLERRKVNWKIMRDINIVNVWYKRFEPAKWPLAESGLLGPVRLVPLGRLDVRKP